MKMKKLKEGFTLIEMIVVIAILGLLMGTLVYTIGGGTAAARAAQCKANLKSLSTAFASAATTDARWQRYPLAGSIEHMDTVQDGNNHFKKVYTEQKGWISWNSAQAYKSGPSDHVASASWMTSAYDSNEDSRLYAMTNGALWAMMNGSMDNYRCPAHIEALSNEMVPNWSYVANAWFGWDETQGANARSFNGRRAVDSNLRADRRLLFAELEWSGYTGTTPNFNSGAGTENDCTLQYKDCVKGFSNPEAIGFNHTSGHEVVAHVVYLDGHVSEIVYVDGQDLKELTQWLCEGRDVALDANSGKYKEMQ